MKSLFLIAVLVAGPVSMAVAQQQPVDGEKFSKYLFSAAHQNLVRDALARIPATVFPRCPGLVSKGSTSTLLAPITFNDNGVPNSGSWKQRFPVEGCGNDTALNVYFFATPEKVNSVVGLAGTTQGSLLLQKDSLTYAHMSVSLKAKDCKTFEVTNTRFEGFGSRPFDKPDPGPNAKFRLWWETWTLAGCGRTFDVPMTFTPDEKGTTIIPSSDKIVAR